MSQAESARALTDAAAAISAAAPEDEIQELVERAARVEEPEELPAEDLAVAMYQAGQVAERLDDPGFALGLFRRALSYTGEDTQVYAGVWFRTAILYQRSGEFEPAIEAYRRAIGSRGAWRDMAGLARFNLAELLTTTEDFAGAIGLLQEVLGSYPGNPFYEQHQVLTRLARCQLLDNQPQAALRTLGPLVEARAAAWTPGLHSLRAEILESLNDKGAAITAYEALARDPFARPELRAAALYRLSVLK